MPKMSLSRFTSVGVAIAAVLALAAPATAAAEVRLQGTISWRLVKAPNPTADQQRAYDLITRAMNAAVSRYNNLSGLTKSITAHYDPNVPTAAFQDLYRPRLRQEDGTRCRG
ncbi:hypothetical protein C8D88_103640 [Lentzea atacamensis]|uniref:Uncharacterized protein n=1 Tax=Lentzea atacamensis TaxID=531938 RepID=A0A316I6R7_9PSEU|nr:hypothetical protein [Lentzea atacamensis]PWK88444.1 hypothetical protein C8D88_103640 [Lentzea atacamensis]